MAGLTDFADRFINATIATLVPAGPRRACRMISDATDGRRRQRVLRDPLAGSPGSSTSSGAAMMRSRGADGN